MGYQSALATANGAKAAECGNIDEAISYYEAASTAESLLTAATLLKDTGCDTDPDQSQVQSPGFFLICKFSIFYENGTPNWET